MNGKLKNLVGILVVLALSLFVLISAWDFTMWCVNYKVEAKVSNLRFNVGDVVESKLYDGYKYLITARSPEHYGNEYNPKVMKDYVAKDRDGHEAFVYDYEFK